MKLDLEGDPTFLAAVRAGVMEALKSPEFIRALAAEMGPEVVWLTAEQTRAITQLAPSTFDRWLKRTKENPHSGLVVSHAFGRKEPRYRFDSVQRAIHQGRTDVDPATAAEILPFPADQPTPGKKRQARA